jgi:hypothetical protein
VCCVCISDYLRLSPVFFVFFTTVLKSVKIGPPLGLNPYHFLLKAAMEASLNDVPPMPLQAALDWSRMEWEHAEAERQERQLQQAALQRRQEASRRKEEAVIRRQGGVIVLDDDDDDYGEGCRRRCVRGDGLTWATNHEWDLADGGTCALFLLLDGRLTTLLWALIGQLCKAES